MASATNAQGVKSIKEVYITVNLEGLPLLEAFKAIEAKSDFTFNYSERDINPDIIFNKNYKRASIGEVLIDISKVAGLKFRQINKNINVNKLTLKKGERNEAAVLQEIVISGKVIDENGEPLPGVNVLIKGTTNGTITDVNGNYKLNAPEDATLIFSFIGYLREEIPVNGRTVIDISLVPDIMTMGEVVVVGYGKQKKEEVTSAISSFKPDKVSSRPVLGPDQMIQGRMPGVSVSSASGSPGSASRVSIRGIGSLSASNEPLYVIDGVPIARHNAALYNLGENMSPLSELNPNDIASVEVLKDAASAAIYGSRATNGVIIITTKSGKKGKPRLSLDAYTGIQYVPNLGKLKMADSELYVNVMNEAIANYNEQNGYTVGSGNYVSYIENPYPGLEEVDWLDLVLRTARTNSVNLSFSGGTDKGTYYISGSYLDQEGAVITNKYKKYTAKINLNQELLPWFEVGANTNFSFSHNDRVPGSNIGSTIMARSLEQRPFDRPYKPDGSYYLGGTDELLRHNAVQILNEEDSYLDNYRFLGNFYAEADFLKDFTFKTALGTDIIYTHDNVYYKEDHPYGTGKGRLMDERRLISNLLFENTLNYNRRFGRFNLSVLGGYSIQKISTSYNSIDGRGFPSPSFDVNSVAAEIASASSGLSESTLISYFGRASMSWLDRYLLTVTMRADGSSKFSPENRFGYFPSASLGWDISKENFWGFDQTDLKVRASYGATGNQAGIGNYSYQALIGGGYNYNNESGIAITSFGNKDLTWETANQFDIGVDLGLLDGKINLTADYFIKNTNNLLYNKPIYATSGFTSITSNVGSMRNRGYELGINTNIELGKVQWSSNFNISFVKNELTSLIGEDDLLIGGNKVLKVGEEVGSFYVYKQLGIYQRDEDVPQSLFDQGVRAGDVIYEDVNKDGNISVDDRQIVGSANPDFFGGWSNTFRAGNFDLTLFLTFMSGNEVYAPWRITVSRLGDGLYAFLEDVALNRWTGEGTSNTVPRAIYGSSYNRYNSTRWLEDGSFLRLRTLSLGYNLPEQILERIKLQNARFYVQADNLFLLTHYSGLDPEVNDDLDPKYLGNDNLVLPQLRTFNVGINLTF